VTIAGRGFALGATVTLNGEPARVLSVASGSISALTPATSLTGAVDLVVVNPDGASARLPGAFTYVVTAPTAIAGVFADPGSTVGGAIFTITGTGFQAGASVTFGGVRAGASLLAGELKGMTPPHPAGTVDVTVTNPDGQSATLTGAYTYVEPGSLDFNGNWEGYGTEGETALTFVIRNNVLTEISCGTRPDAPAALTIVVSPPQPVSNGAVGFSGSDGRFSGRVVTSRLASGTLQFDRCFPGSASWSAVKR
jgi:hypothetical protein